MSHEVAPLSDAVFWDLIGLLDWDRTGDDDAVVEPVVAALTRASEAEIVGFEAAMAEKLFRLDRRDLAGAFGGGSLASDYFSPDAFLYARCVVVANGPELFEAVLAAPTRMPKDMEFEALLSIAARAWERKTGAPDKVFDVPFDYETGANEAAWAGA